MAQHTPGKQHAHNMLEIHIEDEKQIHCLFAKVAFHDGLSIVEAEVNASELVRRWNAHEGLLAACSQAFDDIELHIESEPGWQETADVLRAAIANAQKGAE